MEDGKRVPVSSVLVTSNIITQLKTQEKEGYNAFQFGIDLMKKTNKSQGGHSKKAGIEKTPRFLKEIRVDALGDLSLGRLVKAEEVLKQGDLVDVTGTSKGKGYAGVVKRHHFKGGPRTHGQSDRERAPGSSGQTTTPGRVYKGKRMSGKMGNAKRTVKNLVVLSVQGDTVLLKGLVPGIPDSVLIIKKVGEDKKFIPLFKKQTVDSNVKPEPEQNDVKEKKIDDESTNEIKAEPSKEEKKEEKSEIKEKQNAK